MSPTVLGQSQTHSKIGSRPSSHDINPMPRFPLLQTMEDPAHHGERMYRGWVRNDRGVPSCVISRSICWLPTDEATLFKHTITKNTRETNGMWLFGVDMRHAHPGETKYTHLSFFTNKHVTASNSSDFSHWSWKVRGIIIISHYCPFKSRAWSMVDGRRCRFATKRVTTVEDRFTTLFLCF